MFRVFSWQKAFQSPPEELKDMGPAKHAKHTKVFLKSAFFSYVPRTRGAETV
jgi:hypothetical protein